MMENRRGKMKSPGRCADHPRQTPKTSKGVTKVYHKDERKRDKFDYAIAGIFICSIIVSFNHTIELYKSAGFDVPIKLLNTITEKWLGIGDFFTLALFATLAAEAAFTVGLWGLYEAFKVERKLPGGRYGWTWSMFFGGLIIIGWSNIGGTLGYNYLFGDPYKGYILGLSVPYFVLNAVLVNFSRSQGEETEQRTTEQPKWKKLINTYKEIKAEIATTTEQENAHRTPNSKHDSTEQIHKTEQLVVEQDLTEQSNIEQTEANKPNTEHQAASADHESNKQFDDAEQKNIEQSNDTNRTAQTEQIEQARIEQTNKIEPNEPTNDTEHRTNEQNQKSNIEQTNSTEQNKPKRRTKKSNTNLYVVRSNKTSKTEQAAQCALEWLEQNKEFTVRELADEFGCAVSTAQNALNKARERYQKQA
jgi:hypothetical protein